MMVPIVVFNIVVRRRLAVHFNLSTALSTSESLPRLMVGFALAGRRRKSDLAHR
jgi:hypothetical protein